MPRQQTLKTEDPKNRRPQKTEDPKNQQTPKKMATSTFIRGRVWKSRQPRGPLGSPLPSCPRLHTHRGGGKKPHSAPEIRRWERTHAPKGQVYRKILLSSIHAPVSKLKVTYKQVTYTGGGDIYKWSWGARKATLSAASIHLGREEWVQQGSRGSSWKSPPQQGFVHGVTCRLGAPKGTGSPRMCPTAPLFWPGWL